MRMRESARMVAMEGTNDMDSQLSLSWGRPHPRRPTDDNDGKGSTLSLQLRGRPKKRYRKKWWTTKQSLSNRQRKKRQSKSRLLVRLSKEKIRRNATQPSKQRQL